MTTPLPTPKSELTPDLKDILRKHALYLAGNGDGECANLRDANLRDADLSYADLRDANLRDADLSYADLRDANLSDADLSYADLSYADLRDANLRHANLRDANLSDADLRYANLGGGPENGITPKTFGLSACDADLPRRVAEAALKSDDGLKMSAWHTCETTHCLAGWAVHLSGPAGYALEKATSPSVAGAMLMPSAAHLFYASNEEASAWLRKQLVTS